MGFHDKQRKNSFGPAFITRWRKLAGEDVWIGAIITLAFLVTAEVLMSLGRTGTQAMVMIGISVFLLASLPWE